MSEKSGKKRRLNGEEGVRPSKRTALSSDPNRVKLSLLRNNGGLSPIIASTPGLSGSLDIPFEAYTRDTSTGRQARSEILIHSSAHPRLDYEGRQGDGGPESFSQHYIGAYDPNTREIKLVEAQYLTLRTTLRPEESAEPALPVLAQSNSIKRQELGLEFGTKKAKKAIAARTVNAISPAKPGSSKASDDAEKALLSSISATAAAMPTTEALQQSVDEAKPRPAVSLDATTPRDVYPLSSLLGIDESTRVPVDDWVQAARKKAPVELKSRYVANRMYAVAAPVAKSNDPDAHQRLEALRFLYLLLELRAAGKPLRAGGMRLPKRDVLKEKLGVGGAVLGGVMRRFADGGDMSKWKQDHLLAHICALALHVDNFDTDINDLREDLGFRTGEMVQYFKEVGCSIGPAPEEHLKRLKINPAEAANHRIAKLRIPLQLPKQRIARQRR